MSEEGVNKYASLVGLFITAVVAVSAGVMGYGVVQHQSSQNTDGIRRLKKNKSDKEDINYALQVMNIRIDSIKLQHSEDRTEVDQVINNFESRLNEINAAINNLSRDITSYSRGK